MIRITSVAIDVRLNYQTPKIYDALYPVIDTRDWPKTMMTLIRVNAVLYKYVGAFSVTYRSGSKVARPTDRPKNSFEINKTGKIVASTSVNDDTKETKIAA